MFCGNWAEMKRTCLQLRTPGDHPGVRLWGHPAQGQPEPERELLLRGTVRHQTGVNIFGRRKGEREPQDSPLALRHVKGHADPDPWIRHWQSMSAGTLLPLDFWIYARYTHTPGDRSLESQTPWRTHIKVAPQSPPHPSLAS